MHPIINQLPAAFEPAFKPPPTQTSSGAYNPYATDPGYQQALNQQMLGNQATQSQLQSQIAQRLIGLGDSSLAGKYGLDPAMIQANYNSGNSALSRIDQSHQQNLQAIINRLAAHGIVFSGDTGYQTGQEDRSYGNSRYDAEQSALADILGYRQSALQQQQQYQQGVASALENAYQNYLNHPELGGYGQQPSVAPVPATKANPAQVNKVNQIINYLHGRF